MTGTAMTGTAMAGWEVVLGLEVHAELLTQTKLFSPCPNRFGDQPNTNIDPVSLGLPGTLPVLNKHAVELAIRVGLALSCQVQPSTFARKNYFYPDMPKNYQISQYEDPINANGHLELPSGRRIGIVRAHLEEDTGKSTHIGGGGRIHEAGYSLIDYNRAGVPLIEIVSAPDLRSSEEAKEYVSELRAILVAIGASDGKMEEGSLRVDANVSVRHQGAQQLGVRCEIKNVNSLRSLGRAIDYEAQRQVELLEAGGAIVQETRHWDEDDNSTHSLRSKEGETDYRYFLEPDLLPVAPDEVWIEEIRAALPDLPAQRRQKLLEACGAGIAGGAGTAGADATVEGAGTAGADIAGAAMAANPLLNDIAAIVSRSQDSLALATIQGGADYGLVFKHILNNLSSGAGQLKPDSFAELLIAEANGEISASQAKAVLADLVQSGGSATAAVQARGFEAVDQGELASLLDELINQNSSEWQRFCGGEQKLQGFFVGQIMKATKGQADGQAVAKLLAERKG